MINPGFKLKFLLNYSLIIIAGLLTILFSIYLALPKAKIDNYSLLLYAFSEANSSMPQVIMTAFIIDTLTIPVVVAIIAVLASHKIAGPIFRLQKFLNEIVETRKQRPIQFRTNDQLQETATALNAMTRDLDEHFRVIIAAHKDFEETRERSDQKTASLSELKSKADEIGKAIQRFKF